MDACRTAHHYRRLGGLLVGTALLLVPGAPAWSDDAVPAHDGSASSGRTNAGGRHPRPTDSPGDYEPSRDSSESGDYGDYGDYSDGYREQRGHSGHAEPREHWWRGAHSEWSGVDAWGGRYEEDHSWGRSTEPPSRDALTSPPQGPRTEELPPGPAPNHPARQAATRQPSPSPTRPTSGSAAGVAGDARPRNLLPLGTGLALIGAGAGLIAVRLRRS